MPLSSAQAKKGRDALARKYGFKSFPAKGSAQAKELMAKLRAKRTGARKSISPAAAKSAFTKYWKARLSAAKGSPAKKRGVKAAWARDLAYCSPKRLTTGKAYLARPGFYEYEGVDCGPKRYKAASGARAAALASGRELAHSPASRAKASATRRATVAAYKGKHSVDKSEAQLAAARRNVKLAQAARRK